MPDLDSLLDELLETLDQVQDAQQNQFAEPLWSRLVERNGITSDRLKPLRDRAPLSVRIKIWNMAPDPAWLLGEIASAVEQHQPVSGQADVLKRLRPGYLTLPGAAQLRCLLPLADRFSVYAAMDCDDRVLAEIADAMEQEGQVTEERSASREFWRAKTPSREDPLFGIAPKYYKVRYWTERYQGAIDALNGAVATNGLPGSSWTPVAIYGDNIVT